MYNKFLVLIFLPLSSLAANSNSTQVDFACKQNEKWSFGTNVSENYRKQFDDAEGTLDLYVLGSNLSKSTSDVGLKILGDFFVAKSLKNMGLLTLARERFKAVSEKLIPQNNFRGAAQSCLQAIGSGPGQSVSDPAWLALIEKSRAPATEHHKTAAMQELRNFILAKTNSVERKDWARLSLARFFYEQGDFEKSELTFNQITRGSNYLSQAMMGKAWAQLQRRNFKTAAGSAYGLLFGALGRTFAPEASIIVAISLFETCNYPEALRAIDHFKQRYGSSNAWLESRFSKPKSERPSAYSLAINYIGGKREVPDVIATEWIRSPLFLSVQSDLNAFIDEKKAFEQFKSKGWDKNPLYSRGYAQLLGEVQAAMRKFPERERSSLALIEADFEERTQALRDELSRAAKNIKRVEIDILEAGGSQLVKDHLAKNAGTAEARTLASAEKKESAKGTLDWGKVPSDGQAERTEIWEDELGFLKSDIKDRCVRD